MRRELYFGPHDETARVYVGVDVCKDRLDVCVRRGEAQRHNDTSFVVAHDDAGIETLVSCLLEERAPSW